MFKKNKPTTIFYFKLKGFDERVLFKKFGILKCKIIKGKEKRTKIGTKRTPLKHYDD